MPARGRGAPPYNLQGRGMAIRQDHQRLAVALAMLAVATPGFAQTAPATTSAPRATPRATPPAPPPATAPTADPGAVGPPQLRDFNLNGTVTRRAEPDTPAARPPAPAASSASAPSAPPRSSSAPAARPVRTPPTSLTPQSDPAASQVTAPLAAPTPLDTVAEPVFGDVALPPSLAAPVQEQSSFPWAWLLAVLVAALGAGLLLWRRQQAAASRYASEPAGLREAPAQPVQRSLPRSAAPAPVPPAPSPPPPIAPKNPGGIVATRLRPKLSFELHPIRAETDAESGAAVLFDVIVTNNGSAPARDVLVEGQLINAGPRQDEEITRFFREPLGQGERLPIIPPMGRISIKSRLAIPAHKMRPIELEGRRLFVPLIAFNALYRWSGGDDQDSASFLVGRGGTEDVKMAPFRLDQGARSWTGLGARPHSLGLSAA